MSFNRSNEWFVESSLFLLPYVAQTCYDFVSKDEGATHGQLCAPRESFKRGSIYLFEGAFAADRKCKPTVWIVLPRADGIIDRRQSGVTSVGI